LLPCKQEGSDQVWKRVAPRVRAGGQGAGEHSFKI
jgi:hypothetical protein